LPHEEYELQATRRAVAEWYDRNRLLVMVVAGVDVPGIAGQFEEPVYGDVATVNQNKRVMLSYFSVAFAAYLKYNQTLHRALDPRFVPELHVVEVEVE
jgi:hypothetical protein